MNMTISDFYCTQCGNKTLMLPRKKNKQRESGHLKKLFCIYCQKENNCVEIKPFGKYRYEDFLIELNNDNFNEDGTRKMTYGELKNKIHNRDVRRGIIKWLIYT